MRLSGVTVLRTDSFIRSPFLNLVLILASPPTGPSRSTHGDQLRSCSSWPERFLLFCGIIISLIILSPFSPVLGWFQCFCSLVFYSCRSLLTGSPDWVTWSLISAVTDLKHLSDQIRSTRWVLLVESPRIKKLSELRKEGIKQCNSDYSKQICIHQKIYSFVL